MGLFSGATFKMTHFKYTKEFVIFTIHHHHTAGAKPRMCVNDVKQFSLSIVAAGEIRRLRRVRDILVRLSLQKLLASYHTNCLRSNAISHS